MPVALSLPPGRLRPNPWNTNFVSPENEEKLLASMRRFRIFKPIIVRELPGETPTVYEILGGEHRWQCAIKLEYPEVPVMNLGVISDIEAKEISLADNARYGADDTIALASLLQDVSGDFPDFLPFTDADVKSIFAATDIALDDLDLDDHAAENEEPAKEDAEPKVPKTHTIMRFKLSLGDAERLAELIGRTKKTHGFTGSDDLTNAGDALVQLLLGSDE